MGRLALLAALALALAACTGDDQTAADSGTTARGETGTTPVEAAQDSRLEGIPALVAQAAPSVVAVAASEAQGSGVIWSADGIVVTNNHVVEGVQTVEIAFATGERVEGRVEATDPLTDLAIVRIDRDGLPAATFAERDAVVGELAVAVGNPLGFEGTVTAGIVSGVHRSLPGGSGAAAQALVDLLQTDAPISPGNSGGALVNAEGEVMGVNVAFIPPSARAVSIGFAIPSYTVVHVVEQLLEDGRAEHAFLGVRLADLTPEIAERFALDVENGVVVLSVTEGSGAARAGLEPGDVVLTLDGDELRRVEDLLAALRQRSPGDTVELRVLRDGAEQEIAVTLTARPED